MVPHPSRVAVAQAMKDPEATAITVAIVERPAILVPQATAVMATAASMAVPAMVVSMEVMAMGVSTETEAMEATVAVPDILELLDTADRDTEDTTPIPKEVRRLRAAKAVCLWVPLVVWP